MRCPSECDFVPDPMLFASVTCAGADPFILILVQDEVLAGKLPLKDPADCNVAFVLIVSSFCLSHLSLNVDKLTSFSCTYRYTLRTVIARGGG